MAYKKILISRLRPIQYFFQKLITPVCGYLISFGTGCYLILVLINDTLFKHYFTTWSAKNKENGCLCPQFVIRVIEITYLHIGNICLLLWGLAFTV